MGLSYLKKQQEDENIDGQAFLEIKLNLESLTYKSTVHLKNKILDKKLKKDKE